MSASLGRITAHLAQPSETDLPANLVECINGNINPPTPVTDEDVYIGVMYVVSDEVNSFGGRFPSDEHGRLAELLVDSPVLAGHRKDRLPLARTFHAEVVDRDDRPWVRSFFYWLRESEGAEALKANIDGGVYKECSIGFIFRFPECSVCGKDIRTCPHEPLRRYDDHDGAPPSELAHFNYRQIERVLETSLVYRGALSGTSVRRQLVDDESGTSDKCLLPQSVESVDQLDPQASYLIVPYYEALPVRVMCQGARVYLAEADGTHLGDEIINQFPKRPLAHLAGAFAHLVGYRGRERCRVDQLQRYLDGRTSPVTRLELKLFPPQGLAAAARSPRTGPHRIELIRHRIVAGRDINRVARTIMTRQGIRLWSLDQDPALARGYCYCPLREAPGGNRTYALVVYDGHQAELTLAENGSATTYRIHQFSLSRLLKGGRFIADQVRGREPVDQPSSNRRLTGAVTSRQQRGEGLILELSGSVAGSFALQSVRLDERERYLLYRSAPV